MFLFSYICGGPKAPLHRVQQFTEVGDGNRNFIIKKALKSQGSVIFIRIVP